MSSSRLSLVLFLTANAVITECASLNAANIYIAPDGTASGKGTERLPFDLATALSGKVSRPGDTFWLRGGMYQLGQADTELHGEPGRPITFRAVPGERVQLVGSLGIGGQKGHVIFRDFELYSGVDRRVSRETGAGFEPRDIPHFTEGIQVGAPNISFINLVVHDSVRSAFYTASEATNVLIYGCIVYNTGWASPDNAEGHSYYLQAAGEISENIGFNSTGAGFHVYASSTGDSVRNLTLTGNVAWGAGALQSARPYRDWIVGVDSPAVTANNIALRNNMGYVTTNGNTLSQVQLGRENRNGGLVLVSNYWPQGVTISHWSNAVVMGNTIAPRKSECAIDLQEELMDLRAQWNSNFYLPGSSEKAFRLGSKNYNLQAWKNATGYDSSSSCSTGGLQGTKIFVRPNRYEPGRANIVVYNWDNLNTVTVNVREVMPPGATYEVRNAQDFFSQPVLCGVFSGEPLQLPMNGLSTAKPMARLQAPAATGPTFNVFVLLSSAKKNQ